MNHKQKIGYTILGAFIMLIGILINNLTSPVTAQSNGTFGEIQCTGLTVVDAKGKKLIDLKNNGLGGEVNLYNLSGQEMMKLEVGTSHSKIRLFAKSFGSELYDDSETTSLGIQLDAGPLSNWLEVGNTVRSGGIRLHNTEAFSELQVYHKNGQGGTVLYSSENIHSLSIYDNPDQRKIARKGVGLGIYGDSPIVAVYSKDGNVNARMSTEEYGGRVDVFNKQGKNRAVMSVNEYGNGAVSTWDKNGYRLD